jgi:hypothetical protein
MPWDDWVVWNAWLQRPEAQRWLYAYDVELYTQGLPPGTHTVELIRMWLRATARRIDVVAWDGKCHHLIETRRRAGWSAIGQLQAYSRLWDFSFPGEPKCSLILMSEDIPDDIRAVARLEGIKTWVVGEAPP